MYKKIFNKVLYNNQQNNNSWTVIQLKNVLL